MEIWACRSLKRRFLLLISDECQYGWVIRLWEVVFKGKIAQCTLGDSM